MNTLRKNLSKAGYDQVEAYFAQRDREMIAELRKKTKLVLLQGGKSESQTSRSQIDPPSSQKKAA